MYAVIIACIGIWGIWGLYSCVAGATTYDRQVNDAEQEKFLKAYGSTQQLKSKTKDKR